MRYFYLILVFLLFFEASGQRKRRILFDADVVTPVDSGFYGIGVKDNQPYLINHFNDTLKIKVEYPYLRAWSTGKDLAITLNRDYQTIIALRDSITFTLPSKTDSLNKYIKYDIYYLGWRGGTDSLNLVPFDLTSRMVFSDTIFYYDAWADNTYFTKILSDTSIYGCFKLKPNSRFGLEIINNKWYLFLRDFDY